MVMLVLPLMARGSRGLLIWGEGTGRGGRVPVAVRSIGGVGGSHVPRLNNIQPSALVERYEQFIGQIDLRDKDDRHVVAAATACGAQKIVTWNLSDFPNQVLKAFGIVAKNPDKFMADLIIDSIIDVVDVMRATRQRFTAPPMAVEGFFQQLNNNRLELTARQLERYFDLL